MDNLKNSSLYKNLELLLLAPYLLFVLVKNNFEMKEFFKRNKLDVPTPQEYLEIERKSKKRAIDEMAKEDQKQ